MTQYQRILFATDFSDPSRKAFAEAVRVARRSRAELHVLHVEVIAEQNLEGFDYPPLADYVRSLDQVAMDAVGRDIGPGYRDTVTAVVRDTSEAAGILRYAKEKQIDLIVLGTHGRGAVAEMFLGSVAQRVAREAPVPLLVVGPHHAGVPTGGKAVIVAPVNGTPACAPALAHAAAVAQERDAHLIAVHAMVPVDPRLRVPLEEAARERIESFVRATAPAAEAETVIGIGEADEVVLDVAAKRAASLIVIAPSSHGAFERLLYGSVAKGIVRSAPCPVLVYREATAKEERAAA